MSVFWIFLTHTNKKKAAVLVKKVLNLPLLTLNTTMALTLTIQALRKFSVDEGPHEAHYAACKRSCTYPEAHQPSLWLCPIAETLETSNGSGKYIPMVYSPGYCKTFMELPTGLRTPKNSLTTRTIFKVRQYPTKELAKSVCISYRYRASG